MKKILITGIDGFTGTYLEERLLKHGYDVYGTVVRSDGHGRHVECDITDRDAVFECMRRIQPEYVAHLAAISFVPHADTAQIYRVNLLGTLHVLDACAATNPVPKKIVCASSANVYGNPGAEPIDENIVPAPVNHYAVSKLSLEHAARQYFDTLPIVITRPFNYTGPGQAERFLVPKIVQHFREGKREIELGNIDIIRDFSDVRDVVEAYRMLIELGTPSQTYNICSGRGISLREILSLAESAAGYSICVRVNPAFVRENEIKVLVGDNTKIKTLGWQGKYSIEDTVGSMMAKKLKFES